MTAETKDDMDFGHVRQRIIVVSGIMVVIAAVLVLLLTLRAFERDLLPEVDAKTQAVANALSGSLQQALDIGIPLDRLIGVEDVLDEALGDNPEIGYLAVTTMDDRVLFLRGPNADQMPAQPALGADGARERSVVLRGEGEGAAGVGRLRVGIATDFVRRSMTDIVLDLAVVLMVSLLATFELLMFFINRSLGGPLTLVVRTLQRGGNGDFRHVTGIRSGDEVGRLVGAVDARVSALNERFQHLRDRLSDAGGEAADKLAAARERLRGFTFAEGGVVPLQMPLLTDVRMPLLLYVLAGEMSRSFFPNFVKNLYTPIPGLSYEAVLGLPISAFMFFMASATPISGGWADRIGGRRLFLLSLVPTLVGMVGTGFAQTFGQLIAFWSLNAVGYAMATIACQSRIAEMTTGENRAQGMAVFVTAIMVAAICGTSFGGVIADRIGFRATFVVSAVMVIISGLIVAHVFTAQPKKEAAARMPLTKALKRVSTNGRFIALLVLGAVPAKLILTGFLFYMIPLYLAELGNNQSAIGRQMMVYFAIMIVMSPLFARLADSRGWRGGLVVLGGVVAGIGALAIPYLGGGELGVLAAVVTLGIGHAVATAPLIAMIPEICAEEVKDIGQTALLGVLRVVERIGSVLGPLVAGALATFYSYQTAAQVIGGIVAGTAVLLWLSLTFSRPAAGRPTAPEEAGP